MDHPLFNRIASHSALKQINEDLRADLKNAKIAVLELQEKITKQQHDAVKSAQDENTNLRSELAASEVTISTLKSQVEATETNLAASEAQINTLKSQAQDAATAAATAAKIAEEQAADLRKQIKEATDKVTKATDEKAKACADADAANARYDKLSEDTSAAATEATQKFEELEKQYADTLEKLRETENDLGKVTLEMQSHRADIENITELTKNCEQSKAELEALRLGAQQGAEELRQARDDLSEMTVKFGALSKRHAEVVNEIKGLRVDHDVLVEGVQQTSAELKKALAENETVVKRAEFLEELIDDIKVLSEKEDISAIKSVLSKEVG